MADSDIKGTHLKEADDGDFLALGKLLMQLRSVDMPAFDNALRSHNLKLRKAQYLIEVASAFDGLPVSRDRLLGIGWTKASVIASYVNGTNVDRLLALAEKHPVHLLKEVVGEVGEGEPKRVLLVYVSETEFTMIADTLEKFGASLKNGKLFGTREALVKALNALNASPHK